MKGRIARNTAAYMIVGLAPYIVNFFMLPVYTRFMEPAAYGIVALVNALAAFISPILGLKLASSLNRYFFDYDEEGVKVYFSTIFYSILAVNALILAVILPFGEFLSGIVFRRASIPFYPYVFLAILTVVFSEIAAFFTAFLRVQEKGGSILAVSLAGMVINVALGLWFVVSLKMEALGMLLASTLTFASSALLFFFLVRKSLVAAFRPDLLRKGLRFGLPIIPHALGRVVYSFSDRLILGFFVPVASIGLYNIGDRIAGLLGVAVKSFDGAVLPNFMRLSIESTAEAVRSYKNIITKWAVAVSFGYLGLALFAEELIFVMTPPSYHSAYRFVPILAAGFVFRGFYNFAVGAIMYREKTHAIPLVTFTAGFFNVAANFLLIPRFGVMAAAWTTLASFALTFLLAFYFSNRYYPLEYEWKKLAKVFGLALLAFFAVHLLRTESRAVNTVLKTAAMAAVGGMLYKWNYGNIAGDLDHLRRQAMKRLVPPPRGG